MPAGSVIPMPLTLAAPLVLHTVASTFNVAAAPPKVGCHTCTWVYGDPGYRWSGGASHVVQVADQNACEVACCKAGCDAFTYNPSDQQCNVFTDCKVPDCSKSWSSGWASGNNPKCTDRNDAAPDNGAVGWLVTGGILGTLSAYFFGGAIYNKTRGSGGEGEQRDSQGWLPHQSFWLELFALVVDGCNLAFRSQRPDPTARLARTGTGGGLKSSLMGASRRGDGAGAGANRGVTNKLHVAASLGDLTKLKRLRQDTSLWMEQLNKGDNRCYTAFHVACAGGHKDCARLLVEGGADTMLLSDTGFTGWELAAQLHRYEITELKAALDIPGTRAPITGGDSGGAGLSDNEGFLSAGKRKTERKEKRGKSSRRKSVGAVGESGAAGTCGSGLLKLCREAALSERIWAANGGKGKGLAESKELKAKLKALGLPTKGSKSELKERLKEGEFKAARKRRSSAPATSMAM